ncbi:hypothetical protein LJC48_00160 [Desulfovibrio sp. OttesenSCG-928-C06]|nr:hypothetical protein [Desulfovibrio sp. OttesenSCG-928-C06]
MNAPCKKYAAARPIRSGFMLCALACVLFFMSGCKTVQDQRTDLNADLAQRSWSEFIRLSGQAATKASPYNMILSIRYRSPEDSHRFAAYFWGNAGQSPYPVRLDIQGAMGAIAAKLFENADTFILYDTENNTALLAPGSSGALLQIGLPLPVRLGDLSLLLGGRYQDFFTPANGNDMPRLIASDLAGKSTFSIASGPHAGLLTLDTKGRPVSWSEHNEKGWRFEISYLEGVYEGSLPGPQRVVASHPQSYSITLQVKSFNPQNKEYAPEQLQLIIPEGAIIKES